MRTTGILVAGATVAVAAVAGAYGGWLLATPDEEGVRQAVGALFAGGAGLLAVFAFLLTALFLRR